MNNWMPTDTHVRIAASSVNETWMRTLYPNLQKTLVSYPFILPLDPNNVPIPITVPYSACCSSAFTATGHRQTRAMKARKATESDESMRRDCVRVGRRGRRDMVVVVVVVVCRSNSRMAFIQNKAAVTCQEIRGDLPTVTWSLMCI